MSVHRIIKDEGVLATLKIVLKVLTQMGAKQKVLAIRNVFKQNKKYLTAFGILAEK